MISRMLGVGLAALTLATVSGAQESKTNEVQGNSRASQRTSRPNTSNDFAEWAQQRLANKKAAQAKRLEQLQAQKAAETTKEATTTDAAKPIVVSGPEDGTYQRFAVRQREYMHARRKEKAEEQEARMKELERLHEERNKKAKEQSSTKVQTTGEASETPAEEPKVISRHRVKASEPVKSSETSSKPRG